MKRNKYRVFPHLEIYLIYILSSIIFIKMPFTKLIKLNAFLEWESSITIFINYLLVRNKTTLTIWVEI